MMTAPDVLGVLSRLDDARLTAWVDGGWGVDALLEETTRDHDDLDLAVLLDAGTQVRAHLGYPPGAKDRQDMARLGARLRVELPPPYSSQPA